MTSDSWRIPPVDLALARRLAAELGVSPLVGEVLVRRGFTEPQAAMAFLHPDFRVHNPSLLGGVDEARARVDRALARSERIAVYGDYDADGITATYVLVEALRALGGDVVWRLPNRFSDGYGVSSQAVEALAVEGARLLITVDCGITARDEVRRAQELGLDVVVTDHHEPVGGLPECIIVNPRLGGYPFPHLAGVGVALKLAHALVQQSDAPRVELPLALRPLVDAVAVGTVADVVPLRDENRALVAMGLGRLRSAPRPGLAALLEVAGVEPASVDAATLAFRVAPRLNAAGRLEDASLAFELLSAPDRSAALPLAQRLGELNDARRDLEARAVREALALVPEPTPAAVVLSSPEWHEGVVGIVAARVVDAVNRPTVLLCEDGELAKGSGRSIPAFDILAAVAACSGTLLDYGGHRAACGVRIATPDIPAFREAFVAHAGGVLTADDLQRVTAVDAVAAGDDLTLSLAEELELFAPHGVGNPRVTLLLHGAELRRARLTRDRRHLQCDVRHDGVTRAAVRFGFDRREAIADDRRYDVPAVLARNEFNGMVSARLQLRGGEEVANAEGDLCATPCAPECPDRLRGAALWQALETATLPEVGAAAAVDELRRSARLVDRRRRPAVSVLAGLAGAGGRLLVLVADVARRRPLLSRGLFLPQVVASRLYLNGACAGARLPLAMGTPAPAAAGAAATGHAARGAWAEAGIVMASTVTAALYPELVATFDRVVFLDPPFDESLWDAVLAAVAPQAEVDVLWDDDAVHFAERVAAAEYNVDTACRHVYRTLADAGDRSLEEVPEALLARQNSLAKVPTLAAALRVLDEAGLLADEHGKKRARRVAEKVDLQRSPTYRRWHERLTETTFPARCLSLPL